MDVSSFSEARARLEAVMDRVMVSLSDWTAMEATMHLRSTATNAARLAEALRELNASDWVVEGTSEGP